MTTPSQAADQFTSNTEVEHQPAWLAIQDALESLQKRLRIEPMEMLKLSTHFNCTVRTKLADCQSFGDEGFLQKSYLFILRSAFVSDFNQFKKSIADHPLLETIEATNRFLEIVGADGMPHSGDLHGIRVDEDVAASNLDFVDNMERAIEQLLAYIEKISSEADQLHDRLTQFKSGMKAQAACVG
ncbi:hypothetical protein SAMN05660284_01523 [Formivibrio citricus]|uniref:Uncharacterized protein n=1 Tax=Formivibrio citricus TaxID=83765 RepID=A0A1I4Z4P8_9NEIS|nr:hypothetical protein [Formivibrio citricus]SFN45137.1 hypothetical protein SAMN05660284_01523 [Formivibrio citricus]